MKKTMFPHHWVVEFLRMVEDSNLRLGRVYLKVYSGVGTYCGPDVGTLSGTPSLHGVDSTRSKEWVSLPPYYLHTTKFGDGRTIKHQIVTY